MVDVTIRNTSISSRERKVLNAFQDSDSTSLDTTTLREKTGLDRSRIRKAVQKLKKKGYLAKSTERRVSFWKIDKNSRLKTALEEMAEEGLISPESEVVTT